MIKKFFVSMSFVFAGLNFSHPASALVAGPVKVIGTVKSFDDKTVLVENDESKFEVPKDFVAEKKLKTGNKIEITLTHEQADKVRVQKKKSSKK